MVEAYKRAEASALAPYPYTRLVFSAAAGVLIFGESVAARTFVGAGLIIASSLYLVASESRRSRKAPASPVVRARDA
jgi:drug/metabolite transporter (DMT)-like permease